MNLSKVFIKLELSVWDDSTHLTFHPFSVSII